MHAGKVKISILLGCICKQIATQNNKFSLGSALTRDNKIMGQFILISKIPISNQ